MQYCYNATFVMNSINYKCITFFFSYDIELRWVMIIQIDFL